MKSKCTFLLFICFIFACNTSRKKEDKNISSDKPQKSLVELIEDAHQKYAVIGNKAIQFDIQLFFGGTERLNANLTLAGNSSKGVIRSNDGSIVLYINDKVYYSDTLKNPASVRFSAYTWPYFALLPYKLSDPGTNWASPTSEQLAGKTLDCQKLTFDQGIGDAPDDWYLIYSNPENKLIEYAAYIVTAGSSQEEAEEDPHAIEYKNYLSVDGVPFASNWVFWEWRAKKGLTKELGHANVSNFKIIDIDPDLFEIKERYLVAE